MKGRYVMYAVDLSGRNGIVCGVLNDRSIAWHIAKALHQAGARLAVTYQNERLKERVAKACEPFGNVLLLECDVTNDEQVGNVFNEVSKKFGTLSFLVHSLAFANRQDLEGEFSKVSREGFRAALEVSAFSLVSLVRGAASLMTQGGSVVTMTFQASDRVFPGYNIMGVAKAALENEVRQLAHEYGSKEIRVNAISAGPLDTAAARGIPGFSSMKQAHREGAPLGRSITHEEVGKAALFLVSNMASGITGEILHVDAGYNIMGV